MFIRYTKLNRHEAAVIAYNLVLSKNPIDIRATLLRGKAHSGAGSTENAIMDFTEVYICNEYGRFWTDFPQFLSWSCPTFDAWH